jgi:uncharacterized protein YdaU (DUF1376 family)
MGRIRWYKRDPDAALQGMMVLSLEERGAYNTVLDLIYSNDGSLVDDDRFIAGWLRVDTRVWRRIRKRLLGFQKIYLADGLLRNSRADREVDEAIHRVTSARNAGRISASKRNEKLNENKGVAPTPVERHIQPSTPTPTPIKKERVPNGTLEKAEDDLWFSEFWRHFPKKRAGNRNKAWRASVQARRRSDPGEILDGVLRYAKSDEVARGFAKGAAAWLNDDRWNCDYTAPTEATNGPPRTGYVDSMLRVNELFRKMENGEIRDDHEGDHTAALGYAGPESGRDRH